MFLLRFILFKLTLAIQFDIIQKPYYVVTYRPFITQQDDSYKYEKFLDTKCPKVYDTQPRTKYNFIKNCYCNANKKHVECLNGLSELPNIDFHDSNDWILILKRFSCGQTLKFYFTNIEYLKLLRIHCDSDTHTSINLDFTHSKHLKIQYVDVSSNKFTKINLITPNDTFKIEFLNASSNYLTNFKLDSSINSYDMSENNLNSMVYDENTSLTKLNLSMNGFNQVPLWSNLSYASLEILNLDHNFIRDVLEHDFKSLKSLKFLHLSHNQLESIENGAFASLVNLKFLDLRFNRLIYLPNLLNQINLETLRLDHNFIDDIQNLHLNTKKLFNLKILNLNNNRLQSIGNYTFGHFKNLLDLDLSNNLIEKIEVDAFHISNVSIYGPGLLEKIDLSNNFLDELSNNLFNYLTNLRYLKLNNNKLGKISKLLLNGTFNMLSLDLSMNRLISLDFLRNNSNLEKLRDLKLSNNHLIDIQHNDFKSLRVLRHLDLSSNQISTLQHCAFNGIQHTLTRLLLNNNFITQLNPCALSLNFKHIRFVQVLGNPIDCVSNCYVYYLVFNAPYSLSYFGNECADGLFYSGDYCNRTQFEIIKEKCSRLIENCEMKDGMYDIQMDPNSHLKDIFAESSVIIGDKLKNSDHKRKINMEIMIIIILSSLL